ncbi:hypothetical protein M4I32_03400 [Microbacterium sp. LRZ72]|uniref:FMN-binding protein n=1 Tax=Microbacterium sp. LRZ72 TaxID=2942481 RepID=UPI0029BDA7DD|nr:hypothetical protein [Microbacterium sp. LRZ72]MDX2375842.1 hypothetical protein [Microbacterium sp. LRZ72]
MISATAEPSDVRSSAAAHRMRVGAALVGVAGTVVLAGCASDGGSAAAAGPYTDGTYSATGSYVTPETVETIEVTLTLEGDAVTAVEVVGDPQTAESEQYQSRFIGGISDEVVGRGLDEIDVDRVAGSSLTSGGFDEALASIRAEAAQ